MNSVFNIESKLYMRTFLSHPTDPLYSGNTGRWMSWTSPANKLLYSMHLGQQADNLGDDDQRTVASHITCIKSIQCFIWSFGYFISPLVEAVLEVYNYHHLTSSNQILVNWHHCYHDHVHHHWSLYSETSKSSLLLLRFSSLIWYHVVFNFWSWTGAMCSSISMFVSRTVLSHFKLGPPTVVMHALNISEEEVLGVGRPRQQIIISCRLTNDRSMIESLRLLTID